MSIMLEQKKSWNSELFSLLPSFTRFPLCFLPFPAFSLNAFLDPAEQLATHISTRKLVPYAAHLASWGPL